LGNIRPTFVKRVAIDLVKKFHDRFTEDFYHNRDIIARVTDLGIKDGDKIRIERKRLLNMIAGYVTRYRLRYEA
jgi:small subunit ribosomal protein S17e